MASSSGARSEITADEWRQIVDSAIETAIITLDLDGCVTSWNEGARRIFGWTEPEMLGHDAQRLFPEGVGENALASEMRNARDRGRGGGEEGWRVRKDGSLLWAAGEMTPLRDLDGGLVGFTKIVRDRSQNRGSEEALLEERRVLEVLNRAGSELAAETDLGKLVRIVTGAGVELSGAEFGAFFYNVGDERGERQMRYAFSGAYADVFAKFPIPRATSMLGATFWGEGIVCADDVTQDPRYGHNVPFKGIPEGHPPVRSYLAVPVVSRSGEVIGGLFFGHAEPGRFDKRAQTTIESLAAEAAVAIDNTRLVLELERELAHRRVAEADLAESETRLRLATDAADIGTWDFDPQTGVLTWDPKCKQLFGLPADAEVSYEGTFLPALHPDDREATDATVQRALDPAGSGRFEAEYRAIGIEDHVERWISAAGRAVFENGQPVRFIGTVIDITGPKLAEEGLRRLKDQLQDQVEAEVARRAEAEEALRQAQKMEAVGQLTGGIAHDFNNLLTVVTGNIARVQRAVEVSGAGDPRMTRSLENAMKGADRAAALTQRLLAFARRQPLTPKPIDVDRLVTGMSDLLQRTLGEQVRLEIVTSPGLWRVEADPNQLENAILNLSLNARDAMPGGGELTIETANAQLDQSYVAGHSEVPPGQYVMIAVTDTGVGMSREVHDRAFEPFFTTQEVGKGSGLGLSMIYGFVKQSGGHVKLYSEDGQGTTIKIYLPRLLGDALVEDDESVTRSAAELGGQRETILVVEDDVDVRSYTVESLRELGYRVLEAHDGTSALHQLERFAGTIDLLFTDVVMPRMSGSQLTAEARRLQPGLKVLYTSGYTRNAVDHNGRLDPGVEMIPKPFTFEGLAQRVRDVLDSGDGSVLVVAADAASLEQSRKALAAGGLRSEVAGTASEALGKTRAAQGGYAAVVIDDDLPKGDADRLVRSLRGLHRDLPIVIASRSRAAELAAKHASDSCFAAIAKPYAPGELQEILSALRVRCRGGGD
jgi:PAS domain S-box-containing protein